MMSIRLEFISEYCFISPSEKITYFFMEKSILKCGSDNPRQAQRGVVVTCIIDFAHVHGADVCYPHAFVQQSLGVERVRL